MPRALDQLKGLSESFPVVDLSALEPQTAKLAISAAHWQVALSGGGAVAFLLDAGSQPYLVIDDITPARKGWPSLGGPHAVTQVYRFGPRKIS